MRQEQLYAPALLDILLLYLGLGPCLYITTQYLKWSILLSTTWVHVYVRGSWIMVPRYMGHMYEDQQKMA
jgi:hypothetical protein